MTADKESSKSRLKGCLVVVASVVGLGLAAYVGLILLVAFSGEDRSTNSSSASSSGTDRDEYFNCVNECVELAEESWPSPTITAEDREELRAICTLTTRCLVLRPEE